MKADLYLESTFWMYGMLQKCKSLLRKIAFLSQKIVTFTDFLTVCSVGEVTFK